VHPVGSYCTVSGSGTPFGVFTPGEKPPVPTGWKLPCKISVCMWRNVQKWNSYVFGCRFSTQNLMKILVVSGMKH